jgi:hypothetical protein
VAGDASQVELKPNFFLKKSPRQSPRHN